MGKRILLGSVVVLLVWAAMDFLIHGVILGPMYEASASLWRPMAEMKLGVMYTAMFISALCFVAVYGWFIGDKSTATGVKYGLLFGIGIGVGMGFGTYAVMPIPYVMAFAWFVGTAIEGLAAGLVAGLIVRG